MDDLVLSDSTNTTISEDHVGDGWWCIGHLVDHASISSRSRRCKASFSPVLVMDDADAGVWVVYEVRSPALLGVVPSGETAEKHGSIARNYAAVG